MSKLAGTAAVFADPDAAQRTSRPAGPGARATGSSPATSSSGLHYTETVAQPDPSIADARGVDRGPPRRPRRRRQRRGTAGQSGTRQHPARSSRNLVATITAGKTTPYDKARALSTYFTDPANGFVYSLQTKSGESGSDLVDFLTTGKAGFCQQYAAALGVMLRVAGIPARVVLGYTHPAPDANGQLRGHLRRRARLGRGVLHRHRLAAVRPDAADRRRRGPRGRAAVGAAPERADDGRPQDRHAERRSPSAAAGDAGPRPARDRRRARRQLDASTDVAWIGLGAARGRRRR